jgi:WD40 repeat protein
MDISLCLLILAGAARLGEDGDAAMDGNASRRALCAVAFSPDGMRFAAAGDDGKLRIWRMPDGQLLQTEAAGVPLRSLAYSPSGDRIAAGGMDRRLFLWASVLTRFGCPGER